MGSENLSKSFRGIDWNKTRQEVFYLKMKHNQNVDYLKEKTQGLMNLSFRSMSVFSIKKSKRNIPEL